MRQTNTGRILSKSPTGIDIFKKYVPLDPGRSNIFSKACYEEWLNTRRKRPKEPQPSFRKAIIAHLRAKDGRRPFSEMEETIVLEELRRNEPWPCFKNNQGRCFENVGTRTTKQPGFHESKHLKRKRNNIESNTNKEAIKTSPEKKTDKVKASATAKNSVEDVVVDIEFSVLLEDKKFLESIELGQDQTIRNFPFETESILNTFCDVSEDEINLVKVIKPTIIKLYSEHYDEFDVDIKYPDVCGDLKILRLLRSCYYDFNKAITRTKETIHWRQTYSLDKIRQNLLKTNPCFHSLKKGFMIGNNGGYFAFFSLLSNGNILDHITLKKRHPKDLDQLLSGLTEHYIVIEFRSIFIDRLSRIKRKVVCVECIMDFSEVNDKNSWSSIQEFDSAGFAMKEEPRLSKGEFDEFFSEYNWFEFCRKCAWWLKRVFNANTTYSPNVFNSLHVVGYGYIYNVFIINIIQTGLGKNRKEEKILHLHSSHKELQKFFISIAERDELPKCLGGNIESFIGTDLSLLCLNSLRTVS
eukprot:maker-scaffold_4-snap-gene-16.4-mRNA-1 protein AED:0.02 eAED:0.07 QI:0/0/0.5/1/1/1/2/92/524